MKETPVVQKFSTLKRAGIGIFVAFLLTLPVVSAVYAAPTPATMGGETILAADTMECIGGFSLTVRSGADAGKSLAGVMRLLVNPTTGELRDSNLTLDNNGGTVNVSGQVTGQAIAMVFEQGNTVMFGVGVMQNKASACTGLAAGPFVGPNRDDRGDWDFFPGQRDIR
jgi:hypothetical protein